MRTPLPFLPQKFALSTTLMLCCAQNLLAASPPPAVGQQGMVVTTQRYATEVGVEILQKGGNAIDAAVAVAYALAVVDPCCGNLGGGGFMTLALADGRTVFLNFREKAPLQATPKMFLDKQDQAIPGLSTRGYLAVAVPGTVMGLETARQRYGTMSRKQVIRPAIKLATKGFILTAGDIDIMTNNNARGDLDALVGPSKAFAEQANIAAIFLKNGKPYRIGDRLVQTNLAKTLQKIEADGSDAFYKGSIAQEIVKASTAHGGILSLDDFARYTVEERQPIECSYRDHKIVSAPPPSSGGATLCAILNIVEGYPMSAMGMHSSGSVHALVEAMRHAFVDRNTLLGDPNFVKAPVDRFVSKAYAAQIRAAIDPSKATPSQQLRQGSAPHEGTNTTHFSIVDAYGNAVSMTYTINTFFGATVMAGNTGFFLNNQMDDFTVKPGVANTFGLLQGEENAIAPEKRPLSSMAPTIVSKNGKVFMVLGSPGGSRIISATAATLVNVIDYGLNIQEAVNAPRFHHQWQPDVIQHEPNSFSKDTLELLSAKGHQFKQFNPWGSVEAILIDPAKGTRYGAHDPRRPAGAAIGY